MKHQILSYFTMLGFCVLLFFPTTSISQEQQGIDPLDVAKKLMADENFASASVLLHRVMEQDQSARRRASAAIRLSFCLSELGYNHAAVHSIKRLIPRKGVGNWHQIVVKQLNNLLRKLKDQAYLFDLVSNDYSVVKIPKGKGDALKFELAKYLFSTANLDQNVDLVAKEKASETSSSGDDEGYSFGSDLFGGGSSGTTQKTTSAPRIEQIDLAEALVKSIDKSSDFYLQGLFIEGVIAYYNQDFELSLKKFLDIISLTKNQKEEKKRLRELAYFQIARVHFGSQQPNHALFYYDKIDQSSWNWPEAIYEAGWAHYRLGNYGKALGNLISLHSPFFVDFPFPESHILEAVIYYENCHYEHSAAIINDFTKKYQAVVKSLEKKVENEDPTQWLKEVEESEDSIDIIANQLVVSDPRVKLWVRSMKEIEHETAKWMEMDYEWKQSQLGSSISEVLAARKDEVQKLVQQEAKRVLLAKIQYLKSLLDQALRIQLEAEAEEKNRLEALQQNVEIQEKKRQLPFIDYTDDEKLFWEFDGEFWKDELGTYEVMLEETCQ